MRYLDLFSGIGGFTLGITQAYENMDNRGTASPSKLAVHGDKPDSNASNGDGRRADPTCIGFSEIDKYAVQIYQSHFPEHKNYGDITKINADTLPDFDFLCGGFPCQSFSIAGKRGGFDDTRGTLFFDIARIIKEKRPRYLLLENVKGLLSHDSGNTYKTILATLTELHYDIQAMVLNSKNFGVPQNRERVFIVGNSRGTSRPEVFPFGGISEKDNRYVQTIYDTGHDGNSVCSIDGLAKTQKALGGGQGGKGGLYAIPVLTPDRPTKRQNGRRFKEDGDPSFTLTGQDKHGVFDGMKIRRLTPTECARLQGFPDNWHEGVSDTQAYKCYGNAVTTNVVKEIVKRII